VHQLISSNLLAFCHYFWNEIGIKDSINNIIQCVKSLCLLRKVCFQSGTNTSLSPTRTPRNDAEMRSRVVVVAGIVVVVE
jgi:hypothetical protein